MKEIKDETSIYLMEMASCSMQLSILTDDLLARDVG